VILNPKQLSVLFASTYEFQKLLLGQAPRSVSEYSSSKYVSLFS
jgi:uncharacterized protein (DUF2062 family)